MESERLERIWLHHQREGTDQPWRRDRFQRLCRLLNTPAEEIAALFAIPAHQLNRWLGNNCIPPFVAIHFVGLERAYLSTKTGLKAKTAIPTDL